MGRTTVTNQDPPAAVVDLWRERSGEWRWRYREARDHTELRSNEDYRSREEAARAARVSYPGVPVVERRAEVEPGSGPFWLLLAGGGLLLVLVILAFLGLLAVAMVAVGWSRLRRRVRAVLRHVG
jgi:uncharacterized protein YegP (UPF0339 family)